MGILLITWSTLSIVVCIFGLGDVIEAQRQSPCRDDEFYDGVVDQCALCRDICDVVYLRQSTRPCMLNCPEFYRKLNYQPVFPVLSTPAVTSWDRSSVDYVMPPPSQSWMNNPLIWTTFVALLVAAMATVAIAVLVVVFRCQRKEVRYTAVVESASKDSSSSTLTGRTQGSVTAPDVLVYESDKTGTSMTVTSPKT